MSDRTCALPGALALHLTEACNLRCKMCYEWGETGVYSTAEKRKKPATLDHELVKRIISELAPRKPFYSLFGGEPLMYPHLEEVIVAIKEAGSIVDTPTNGTLLAEHARMLVQTGFDMVRVSIDGPREINDLQRGANSFDKAMGGIETLHEEKQKASKFTPNIGIIYTVTPENHLSVEQFFLKDLNLDAVGMVTIQMQNFLTDKMGKAYARMLESEFGITGDRYWRAMLRSPEDFSEMDTVELARQVETVTRRLKELGKLLIFLPRSFSSENISAYLGAKWDKMPEKYSRCPVPWTGVDITAGGNMAPCHVFYDFVMGNLYDHSFEEVWNGEKFQSYREYMKRHGLMSICHGCCILYLVGS